MVAQGAHLKQKAIIAAVLNFLVSGIGYLYLKKRVVFGSLLLLGEVFILFWFVTKNPLQLNLFSLDFLLGAFFWQIALAYDAYRQAFEN